MVEDMHYHIRVLPHYVRLQVGRASTLADLRFCFRQAALQARFANLQKVLIVHSEQRPDGVLSVFEAVSELEAAGFERSWKVAINRECDKPSSFLEFAQSIADLQRRDVRVFYREQHAVLWLLGRQAFLKGIVSGGSL
jgi:hypothetical protein